MSDLSRTLLYYGIANLMGREVPSPDDLFFGPQAGKRGGRSTPTKRKRNKSAKKARRRNRRK